MGKFYTTIIDTWISDHSYKIDDENKKDVIRTMFNSSHVALVYGSAGTGKSTLIKHISNCWENKEKLFLANTHPAVDNMRRKITAPNSEFMTIEKLRKGCGKKYCDILFVDECSTVSNGQMQEVLDKVDFSQLVLTGDIYQIESIRFGNWLLLFTPLL